MGSLWNPCITCSMWCVWKWPVCVGRLTVRAVQWCQMLLLKLYFPSHFVPFIFSCCTHILSACHNYLQRETTCLCSTTKRLKQALFWWNNPHEGARHLLPIHQPSPPEHITERRGSCGPVGSEIYCPVFPDRQAASSSDMYTGLMGAWGPPGKLWRLSHRRMRREYSLESNDQETFLCCHILLIL